MQFNEYNSYNASKSFYYNLSKAGKTVTRQKIANSSDNTKRDISSVETFLRNVFLPEGYPNSVSDDYLSYQIWDTIQAFASSISGSLATQAVLEVYIQCIYLCHVIIVSYQCFTLYGIFSIKDSGSV